jgi:hypothetical protein
MTDAERLADLRRRWDTSTPAGRDAHDVWGFLLRLIDERDAALTVKQALRRIFELTKAECIEIHSGDREPGQAWYPKDVE